jgi:Zn-dependent protease
LAGPASNLLMALCWGLVFKLALMFQDSYFAAPLMGMADIGIKINIVLIALNMLPLPPLDGGRVAVSLLPHRQSYMLSKLEPYGMIILIVMVMTPVLGWVLYPTIAGLSSIINLIFGL